MPMRAATAATCRVWLDWTPPIETSVSQPCATASATRYSSFLVLLPPNANPLLQSSRLAHTSAPPSALVSRSRGCTGEGPKSSCWRADAAGFMNLLESRSAASVSPGRHSIDATILRVTSAPDAGAALERGDRVWLRKLRSEDEDAFLAMVAASRSLHHPWTSPPADIDRFRALVARGAHDDLVSLVGWRAADNTLVAVVHLSQIVRGLFQSCYCGFYANAATAGQGFTRETLQLALRY